MGGFRLKLRTSLVAVAMIAALLGVVLMGQTRSVCLDRAREFRFWEEFNRDRAASLESTMAQSESLAARYRDEVARARAEADRCGRVRRMLEGVAARPWLPMPPRQFAPSYAPDRRFPDETRTR